MEIPKYQDKIKPYLWDKEKEKEIEDLIKFSSVIFKDNMNKILSDFNLEFEKYIFIPSCNFIRIKDDENLSIDSKTGIFLIPEEEDEVVVGIKQIEVRLNPFFSDSGGQQSKKGCAKILKLLYQLAELVNTNEFQDYYIRQLNSFLSLQKEKNDYQMSIRKNKLKINLYQQGLKLADDLKDSGLNTMDDIVDYIETLDAAGLRSIQHNYLLVDLPFGLKEKRKEIINIICEH